jgi:copper chaperone CopZ
MIENVSEEIVYRVPEVHCAHCRAAIQAEVDLLPEVDAVEVDLKTKIVTVWGSNLDDLALRAAIAEAGYEVEA